MTPDDVRDILEGEISEWEAAHSAKERPRIAWEAAARISVAFNLFRPYEVEVALAEDFESVRDDRWRTIPVVVRLPRFIVDSIEDQTDVPGQRALADRVEEFLLDLFTPEQEALFSSRTEKDSRP